MRLPVLLCLCVATATAFAQASERNWVDELSSARRQHQAVKELIKDTELARAVLPEVFRSKDTEAQRAGLYVLQSIDDPALTDLASRLLYSTDQLVKNEAIFTHVFLQRPRSWAHHGEPVGGQDYAAIIFLGDAAVPALVQAEKHWSSGVRQSAQLVMTKLPGDAVVEPLLQILDREDGVLLHSVVARLAPSKDPRVVPAFVRNIDKGMRFAYTESWTGDALRTMEGRALAHVLDVLKRESNWYRRLLLVELLGSYSSRKAWDRIHKATSDVDGGVRFQALRLLVKQKDKRAPAALKKALKDPEAYIREYAEDQLVKN